MMIPTRIRCFTTERQRYDTVGDWKVYNGDLAIIVSQMSDRRYESLVALHEIVEALLCLWTGVSQSEVDHFDMNFPANEPGDDPRAPYHRQHVIASVVERLAAELLGVDWNQYNAEVDRLAATR